MKNPAFAKATADKVRKEILGKQYELSFAFINEKESRFLNNKYRRIDKPTDVLSFRLSENSGEILICKTVARKKAKDFAHPYLKNTQPKGKGISFTEYLLFLVIHGSLHLKGLKHSDKMNKYEFTHYSRYRRRYLRSESRSCRTKF